jgi:hypothetical protein
MPGATLADKSSGSSDPLQITAVRVGQGSFKQIDHSDTGAGSEAIRMAGDALPSGQEFPSNGDALPSGQELPSNGEADVADRDADVVMMHEAEGQGCHNAEDHGEERGKRGSSSGSHMDNAMTSDKMAAQDVAIATSADSARAGDLPKHVSQQEVQSKQDEHHGAPFNMKSHAEQMDEVRKDPKSDASAAIPNPAPPPQPRLDMLIPTSSHAFVLANMIHRGIDLNTLFSLLLQDGRAVTLMSNMAKDSLQRAGLSSASAEIHTLSVTGNNRKSGKASGPRT